MSEKTKDKEKKNQPKVDVRDIKPKKDPKGGPGGAPFGHLQVKANN